MRRREDLGKKRELGRSMWTYSALPCCKSARSRRRLLIGAAASWVCAPSIVHAQAKVLKIGVLLPRSGYLAPAGQSCHRGALIAPKVLADYGLAVELVHVDIESNADVARTQCER